MKRAWNISGSLREHLIEKASSHPSPSSKLTIFLAQPFSFPVTGTLPCNAHIRLTRGICDEASSSACCESVQSNTFNLETKKLATADFKSAQRTCDQASSNSSSKSVFSNVLYLQTEKFQPCDRISREEMQEVTLLKDELFKCHEKDPNGVIFLLNEKASSLLKSYPSGPVFVELLEQLRTRPALAFEVLNWRRKQASSGFPLTSEEYSKAIFISGRARNIVLAAELFTEADNMRAKSTSTYNSMLGAYMVNGLTNKCRDLFERFKEEENFRPNIVTYNILISIYGRLTMVDQMEALLQELEDQDLFPTLRTYNHLIAGYLTAWSWDRMEKTFLRMKDSYVEPDLDTYLYMLRGYAYAGKYDKMEEMYELIKEETTAETTAAHGIAVRVMINGYCQSFHPDRVSRIEELVKLLSEDDYRPWLHVELIRLYAKEDRLEKMEKLINEAFERHTLVMAVNVMRSIVSSYFRLNDVDKLSQFVKRAEDAGWRLCMSLYHCKMVMFGAQNRMEEMEGVLSEMERLNLSYRTKKTFSIMYRSYMKWGQIQKAKMVIGLLWKCGHEIPEDVCAS